jgi:hypothetical protein
VQAHGRERRIVIAVPAALERRTAFAKAARLRSQTATRSTYSAYFSIAPEVLRSDATATDEGGADSARECLWV